jgi:hypothetical protein
MYSIATTYLLAPRTAAERIEHVRRELNRCFGPQVTRINCPFARGERKFASVSASIS